MTSIATCGDWRSGHTPARGIRRPAIQVSFGRNGHSDHNFECIVLCGTLATAGRRSIGFAEQTDTSDSATIYFLGALGRRRCRKRTPGPPPLSSMNSTPAASKARPCGTLGEWPSSPFRRYVRYARWRFKPGCAVSLWWRNYLERLAERTQTYESQLQCRSGINAEISWNTCQVSTLVSPSTGSLPPRSRPPPPEPHTSAAAVLINELNARDFDRSFNLFCGVFTPTQLAIHWFKSRHSWFWNTGMLR